MELQIFQRDVAEQIGVTESTIWRWERNETNPPARHISRIIQFLGYNPFPPVRSLSEKLKLSRKLLGLTQRAMAKRMGVDATTLLLWETGKRRPSRKRLGIVEAFLKPANSI
jgi:transcriptional regulator with XRE-family HTH domain